MLKKIEKQILELENDINLVDAKDADTKIVLILIRQCIKDETEKYLKTNDLELKESIKNTLVKYYNLMYYYQAKTDGLDKAYLLDQEISKLPDIYVIDGNPTRFDINEELLNGINVHQGLTEEEALELLKWTSNNTRDNLNILEQNNNRENVYGNNNLSGACGLSQFSTLYPLKKLGLEVTINNAEEVKGGRHAYGTVIIPIKTEKGIENRRYLLDCTYRQFFTLPYNVLTRYMKNAPFPGYFMTQDNEQTSFAKELLQNGFIEANLENMEKYLKPFFSSSVPLKNVNQIGKEFSKYDIFEILDKHQDEFDYEESEFLEWGLNLDVLKNQKKR